MSFDLNKSNSPVSKFNLEKTEEQTLITGSVKSKNKTVWFIAGLVVVGTVAWWIFRGKPDSENKIASIQVEQNLSGDSTATKVKTPIIAASPLTENATTKSDVAALQNSVPGNFDPGSAAVQPDDRIVNQLVAALDVASSKKILVRGYASSEGDLLVNQQLSAKRASAFKDYLVAKGISADRIITEAKGIEDPIASNETEDGRRKNRRVQVSINN